MDAPEVRAAFREFAGPDRYCRFVRFLNLDSRNLGRLFFWQEELWGEFVAVVPVGSLSPNAVMDLFRICDLHDCELVPTTQDAVQTEIRHTPEYDSAFAKQFPLASCGNLECPECLGQQKRWVADHHELCRILRRPITYEAYCERLFEGIENAATLKGQVAGRVSERSAEIAAQMKPGDELWEWDGGGWHQLRGRGGVAIVREGKIIKQWCEIRS